MGGSEEFETLLKDVVNGKRLSASKTTKLTEIALKNMQNDTQMVSVLYRTHKTLPTSSKVASLYIFDALCRAARSQVVKHQLTGDIHTEKGNSATFLLKIEGILDGLIEDLMSTNSTEIKEKTQKILDIWAKSTTFPANVVKRLQETVKEKLKDPPPVVPASTTSDPRQPKLSPTSTTPPTGNGAQGVTPPPAAQVALPASLVALLGPAFSQSAPASDTNQTLPNSFAGLDPAQLSLLQQIAEQAKLNSGLAVAPTTTGSTAANGGLPHALSASSSNHHVPTHAFASSSSTMSYPHPHSPPTTDPRINSHSSRDRGTEKWDDNPRDRSHQSNYNGADRNEWRGGRNGARGGSYGPGRGGGGGRGRWDDRGGAGGWREGADGRHRSRSRSPPPRGRAQDERPRRDPRVHSPRRSAPTGTNGGGHGAGKDEFGRDIRATSTTPPPAPGGVTSIAEATRANTGQSPPQNSETVAVTAKANPQPPTGPRAALATQNQPQTETETPAASTGGLDTFDFSTFDFTSAASWEALGKAWEVSYGQPPSQEELMMAMSGSMMGYGGGGMGMMGGDQNDQGGWGSESGGGGGGWQQQPYNSDRGRGGFRGRGRGSWRGGRSDFSGHGYGDYGNGYASDDVNAYAVANTEAPEPPAAMETGDDGAGEGGGRMKRVGDKWVWQPPT